MIRSDRLVCIGLFVVLSSVYFATVSGITCSNDGSHYALTRAMAEERRFTIESYDAYAEGNDIAVREGQLYSDRPPGTALLASVFYKIGNCLPAPLVELESRHDAGNPRLLYVMLLPVWSGAGTVVLLYLLLRHLDVSGFAALTASFALGLATVHWKYSTVLFSHAPSALLVMASIYLAVRRGRATNPHWSLPLAAGFLVGLAVLVEYSNALLVPAVGLYLVLTTQSTFSVGRLGAGGLFVAGGLLPTAFLAFYNTVSFGAPHALSYDYAVNYPWAGQLGETFSFPLMQGLRSLLVWGEGGGWCDPTCYNQGLFLLSPVLLLSAVGTVPFCREAKRGCALSLGVFAAYVLLFAKHRTFHGFTADGRYLTPFLALWCLPLAFFLDRLDRGRAHPAWRAAAQLVVYALLFVSIRNIFLHIGFSYHYSLDLGQLGPMIARPGAWSYLLGQVFRNLPNLPLLWLCEGLALTIGLGVWCGRRRLVRG